MAKYHDVFQESLNEYRMPSTIMDATVLDEITDVLNGMGLPE